MWRARCAGDDAHRGIPARRRSVELVAGRDPRALPQASERGVERRHGGPHTRTIVSATLAAARRVARPLVAMHKPRPSPSGVRDE